MLDSPLPEVNNAFGLKTLRFAARMDNLSLTLFNRSSETTIGEGCCL